MKFDESVNPNGAVDFRSNRVIFTNKPEEQFFFSNLSGGREVQAQWEATHLGAELGIRETGDFQTRKINLWGWGHVLSPELFVDIKIEPGDFAEWKRTYEVFEING